MGRVGWGGDDDISITCTHVTCLKHLCIPGGRPPTESLKDVGDTGFFDRFRRGCTVHADGNKAWKSESKRRSVKFASVSHNKMQFTKWRSKD